MTYRERPAVNRYLEQKEQEYAYRKHAQALANARPTINTQKPEIPNRIRFMKRINADNRKRIIQQNEEKMRLLNKARSGKKSATLAKVETTTHSARRRQNIYDDIDLFTVDKTNYKSSTSRIRRLEEPVLSESDSDDIPFPSDDFDDDDEILFGHGGPSESHSYMPDHQSESIRIGYGNKLVESVTESTSIISSSEDAKKRRRNAYTDGKTSSSSKKSYNGYTASNKSKPEKEEKIPIVSTKNNSDKNTFLTTTTTDESEEIKRKSSTSITQKPKEIIKADIAEKEEKKEEEKPVPTSFSLKGMLAKAIEKEDEEKKKVEKEEEKLSDDEFGDNISEDSDKGKEPEKELIEEDLFSSDDPDTISEKSPVKETKESKEDDDIKLDDSDSNFESDDLNLPDF